MANRASEIPLTRILAGSVNPSGATSISAFIRPVYFDCRWLQWEFYFQKYWAMLALSYWFVFSVYSYVFITADSNSERVVGLIILSAYRPIQCGGNCYSAITSRLGSYYLFTDHCNVEKNVLWLRLWAGFPLSVYELMLMWRNLLSSYVSHWVSTIQLWFFSWVSATYFADQRRIMGEMKCCLLVWVSATCFQTNAG